MNLPSSLSGVWILHVDTFSLPVVYGCATGSAVRRILIYQLAIDAINLPRLLRGDLAPDALTVGVVGVVRSAARIILNGDDVIVAIEGSHAVAGVSVFELIANRVVADSPQVVSQRKVARGIETVSRVFFSKSCC